MAAGRPGRNPDSTGINVVIHRVKANEADGPMHVVENFRNRKFRLTAVHDGKNRVASLDQLRDWRKGKSRLGNGMRRYPPTANDPHDAGSVGFFLRRKYVHGERHAVLTAIHDVASALEWLVLLGSRDSAPQNN